MHIYTTAKW